jgi:hypothetical protein
MNRTARTTSPDRRYEIRCPVHGFISFDAWEREIIEQPWFQRLRRIRQLAWTDHLYPGAMHTRFEHTLGVMHVATRLFDGIVQRSAPLLASELSYREDGLRRHRALVRIAALLHDIGHGPFSHAGEELLPPRTSEPAAAPQEERPRYSHEEYSAAVVRRHFHEAIEKHPLNTANYAIRAEEVAALLEGSAGAGSALFWRGLITGQSDADRMDYLLRDSHHLGVQYGRFDLDRVANTIRAVIRPEAPEAAGTPDAPPGGPAIGFSADGWHAVEGLVLARYLMFTQVYFHHTRVAFDHHLRQALKCLLPAGAFPPPSGRGLRAFQRWDDWRVLGLLARGKGGEHGGRLAMRNHYRLAWSTPEVPTQADMRRLEKVRTAMGDLLVATERADRSWYRMGPAEDILIEDRDGRRVTGLSTYSKVVPGLRANNQVLLYTSREHASDARRLAREAAEAAP